MVRVFTCTVFIVFTMMWFGCFLVPVEARLFCRVSSVQLLWGRCVRQLWGSTSASHSQVVVLIGCDRKCDRPPKVLPDLQTKKKERQFSTKAPRGSNTGLFIHRPVMLVFLLKTPSSWAEEPRGRRSGGGHKRSASWGSADHLREVKTSVFQYSHFSLAPPTDRM